MKIRSVAVKEYAIPFRGFASTRISKADARRGFILTARTDNELRGLGEAAPCPGTSQDTLGQVRRQLLQTLEALGGLEVPAHPQKLTANMSALAEHLMWSPSLRFGVETMLADLASQEAGLPLSTWYRSNAIGRVPVNTIILGGGEAFQAKIVRKLKQGCSTFKLKVGAGKPTADVERVRRLREIAGNDAAVRLDANRRFSLNQALRFLGMVASFNIEYIEEPLRPADLQNLPQLKEATGVAVALDETVAREKLMRSLLQSGLVDVVVLKPTVLGGIGRCLEIARLCAAYRIKLVVTSALETGVGLTACVHLAAILGDQTMACGLDTLELIKEPLTSKGLVMEQGVMPVPDRPGLGVELAPLRLGDCWDVEL